jgi:citrate lyase subunit beta / citryl-CoA lyase
MNSSIKLAQRPRRVLVFVPASVLMDKTNSLAQYASQVMHGAIAAEYRPDCLIFDLEDSVSASHKVEAAQILSGFLDSCDHPDDVEVVLRINRGGPQHQHDRERELASQEIVDAIMIPKVDQEDYHDVLDEFGPLGKPLLPIIETTAAFNNRERILLAMTGEVPRLGGDGAAVLGLDDLAADLRIARDVFFQDAAYRSMLGLFVSAVRQAGLVAIGPVYNIARDPSGAAEEARQLCRLGFQGCLCVFPPYVRPIKAAFTPTAAAEQRAMAIRVELEHAGRDGYGWIIYEGIKYDLADLPYQNWLIAHAAGCRERDSH